ncbi:MAG: pyridoxamine 5'-phosphate oxidase family protein [Candidatus Eiseniibacteriota bacterium]
MYPETTIRQHAERSVPEEVSDILGAGTVAHVGFGIGGEPYIIPMSYHFDPADPGRLFLHGAPSSRLLGHLVGGGAVCVAVTLVEGLVYSKTAKYHSMNYRSAVVYGRAFAVTDRDEKARVFAGMIARYFPGRASGRDYAEAPAAHLDATATVEVRIEAASAKARRGGPKGPHDARPEAPGTAGILPFPTTSP